MKVLSSKTKGIWLEEMAVAEEAKAAAAAAGTFLSEDPAKAEARRALSEVLRSSNLVVLRGLGTSLCVKPQQAGGAKPLRMANFWNLIKGLQDAHANSVSFGAILELVGHPPALHDIEALLLRCRLAESFVIGKNKDEVVGFIALAEDRILKATDFVDIDHELLLHS